MLFSGQEDCSRTVWRGQQRAPGYFVPEKAEYFRSTWAVRAIMCGIYSMLFLRFAVIPAEWTVSMAVQRQRRFESTGSAMVSRTMELLTVHCLSIAKKKFVGFSAHFVKRDIRLLQRKVTRMPI